MKKSFLAILSGSIGAIAGAYGIKKLNDKTFEEKNEMEKKLRQYYDLMNYWMKMIAEGKTIHSWLEDKQYKNIVIYGMGELGNRLYEQIKNMNIVAYAIDQNPISIFKDLNVVSEVLESKTVDAVIITPVYDFGSIKSKLASKFDCDIISLEDMIYDI